MTCSNCEIREPGRAIIVKSGTLHCIECGKDLRSIIGGLSTNIDKSLIKWDSYFHSICLAVATKSPCMSRKIGAILVRDNSIVSTGYNGPARGIPHCGHERYMKDKILSNIISSETITLSRFQTECPRKVLGYESGTYLELCPAQHAERNAINNAARNGVSTLGCTLYMNAPIPCKDCISALINSGIIEIVVDDLKNYDQYSQFIIDNSSIKIRTFNLEK